MEITTKIAKEAQERYGYTDDPVKQLKENQIRLINNISKLTNYRLVAEVVESENCGWNAKVGDKIVLSGPGWILPAECTNKENTCLFAVSELTPFSWMLYDRVCSGHDPEDMIFKRVRCKDPGVEHCGWGQIVMEIRAELAE
jgi:hypothetical protein